jgi:hypothetical protein
LAPGPGANKPRWEVALPGSLFSLHQVRRTEVLLQGCLQAKARRESPGEGLLLEYLEGLAWQH